MWSAEKLVSWTTMDSMRSPLETTPDPGRAGAITDLRVTDTGDPGSTLGPPLALFPCSVMTLRRKPPVEAYVALLFFMVNYFCSARGLDPRSIECAIGKDHGDSGIARSCLFSLVQAPANASGKPFSWFFWLDNCFFRRHFSPVWQGGAFQRTLDFAKVLMIVPLIIATVTTSQRLRVLIFAQAISVSAIAAVAIWKGRLLVGRLEGMLGGNYADPNDMALAIIISLPLCLALLFLSRNWLWKIF